MLRILLIEDNPGDARLIQEMLKESGIQSEIECVDRLSSGIGQIKLDGFDVILLDLGLPDSQGLGTLIKLNEIRPEAPVIVLTGLSDEEIGTQAVKQGAQDYLVKGQIDHHLLSRSIKYAIERAKVEAEREQYFKFFKTSADLMCMADPNGAFIKTNPACSETLGYTEAELVSKPFVEFVHPDDKQSTLDEMAGQLQRGFTLNFENRYICKDGSVRWLSWRAIYNKDERITYATALDITERRQLEAAAKEQRKRFETFFDTSITPLAFLDKDFNFIRVNKAYADADKKEISYFPGRNHFDLYPSDAKAIFEDVVRTKKAFQTFARPFVYADHPEWGVTYWDWTLVPILDNKGEIEFLVFSLVDVTKQKKNEEERERLTSQLMQKTSDLEQILYAASHDLKTPLVNINGYTGELKKSIEDILGLAENGAVSSEIRKKITSLAKELPESFKFISSSVSRMDRLLNGLLQFSRSGSVDLKIEEIDMNTLINEIAGNLNYRLKEAGASLEVAGLPGCAGDREQLNRIFSNLMENAVKYLDPARKGEIKVTGYKQENSSVYCVEDNGIGIAVEHQKQIFHIFHQLDPLITGEGLGLAIVQRMVERHGGKIWLESEKGKGCRFCVALPRKQ